MAFRLLSTARRAGSDAGVATGGVPSPRSWCGAPRGSSWVTATRRENPEPSQYDIAITRQLADGAKLLGIRLLDHIIVGDGCYFSLQERRMLP